MGQFVEGGRGIVRVCPACNRTFYIDAPGQWVYKRYSKKDKEIFFHTWSCMRKDKEEREQKLKETRARAARLGHQNRKKAKNEQV